MKYTELNKLIRESDNIVFFGGAGVSTESGIPDFRSAGGIYSGESDFYGISPEEILSATFFRENTEAFYRFYKAKMLFPNAIPNAAHYSLAKLEKMGKLKGVITQNIDGLHQTAGSRTVIELHGSVLRNRCMKCRKAFELEYIIKSKGIPRCDECGSVIKPEVTLYEEQLPEGAFERAAELVSACDLFIIGGTSLAVYPASTLVRWFRGRNIVIINKSETKADKFASLVIHAPIGEVLDDATEGV